MIGRGFAPAWALIESAAAVARKIIETFILAGGLMKNRLLKRTDADVHDMPLPVIASEQCPEPHAIARRASV
ncbi:hypothetical protein [Actinoplanes aureus]|uniref:Uncharacterized protein n=1 Tax=Actinoplanes aureus TaxID=2792083 RepID=A0A931FX75_9ACTN|nr:hypothetical protein [Actinoplanes aureus]MBG0562170.1 hypothetical protein [Actinoplanes aureus]